jgi:transcriptional regulator with XRE-family HTH domain
MELAASEFLRAIRGSRSQVAFARRLGYRGNPITDWERGDRFPTAAEALRAAACANIDVAAAFARFSPQVPFAASGRSYPLDQWLSELRGTASVNEIAERSGASRFSVSRWLRGKAKPRLPEFMRLVDAITGRLPYWVSAFVPIESVPSLEERFRAAEAARSLAFELPWTEAVLRLLETEDYRNFDRHPDGWIASILGVDVVDERRCLDGLVTSRAAEFVNGRYAVRGATAVDTQGGAEALHRIKQHWCDVARAHLTSPREGEVFAYNVVSISRKDLQTLREKLRSTFRDIRSMVASSHPEEVAAIVNLQLIAFDPASESAPEPHRAAAMPRGESGHHRKLRRRSS